MFKFCKFALYNPAFWAICVLISLILPSCSLSYGKDRGQKKQEEDIFVELCMSAEHADAIDELANGHVSPFRLSKILRVVSLLGNRLNTPEKGQAVSCINFVPRCIFTYQMLSARISEANLRCPSSKDSTGNGGAGNGGAGGGAGNGGAGGGSGNGGAGGGAGNGGAGGGSGNGGAGGGAGNGGAGGGAGNDGSGNGGAGGGAGNDGSGNGGAGGGAGNDGSGNGGAGNGGSGNDGNGNGGAGGGEERERDESASLDSEVLARLATPSLPLSNGDENVPSSYEERKTILEEQYGRILSLPGLDGIQADLISQGETAENPYPGTDVNTPAGYRQILTAKALPLGEDGKIPAMVPYEPPTDTSVSDAGSTSRWRVDYYADFDSDNNPRYIVHVNGWNRIGIVDTIATGTRKWDAEKGKYVRDSFEPTEEHLPLRQKRIVAIPPNNAVPNFKLSHSSYCNNEVTGDGSKENPYQIYTFAQFNLYMRTKNTEYLELGCDIDASSTVEMDGGKGFSPIKFFAGHLNGGGYKIANLHINRPDQRRVGLFAHLIGATVQNLIIEKASVIGKYQVGILAGHMVRSSVHKVTASGSVQGAGETGGLVGFQTSHFFGINGSILYRKSYILRLEGMNGRVAGINVFVPYRTAQIDQSHVNVLVNCARGEELKEAHRMCGGLVGWMGSGFITSSSARGNVIMSEEPVLGSTSTTMSIDGDMAGGLVGAIGTNEYTTGSLTAGANAFQKARISQSYSKANVYGGLTIGGLLGAGLSGGTLIKESYAEGRLEGNAIMAGLVAMLGAGYVINSYTLSSIFVHDVTSKYVPASHFVHIFYGFANSMASGDDHFSYWQRLKARYFVASRFKIGVENSYAHNRIQLQSARNNGRQALFISGITGAYYRLDGTVGSVVENITNNYIVEERARNINNRPLANAFTRIYFLSIQRHIWSDLSFKTSAKWKAYPNFVGSGNEISHVLSRSFIQFSCVKVPGVTCQAGQQKKRRMSFLDWNADIVWLFSLDDDYPRLRRSSVIFPQIASLWD